MTDRTQARERNLLRRIAAFDHLPDGATLSFEEVRLIVGLGRATVYRHMNAGTFPRPARTDSTNRWRVADIRAFLARGGKR